MRVYRLDVLTCAYMVKVKGLQPLLSTEVVTMVGGVDLQLRQPLEGVPGRGSGSAGG